MPSRISLNPKSLHLSSWCDAMKAIIVGIFVVLSLVFMLPIVNAQPYFAVYPTEGNVNTDIFLQIRGLPGTGFYEYYYLYIFWDDILLGTFPDNSGTYEHYFDTHFSPPNNWNYSALGNHTVYFEVWNNGRTAMFINATFVFTITEYIPCPEYLALNATYYQLLAEYNSLNASYQNLMAQYNTLSANYDDLLNQYSNLSGNYYNLLGSYNSLVSDYDEMKTTYHELETNYQSLNATYFSLNTGYQNLSLIFSQLQNSYNGLIESYTSLQSIHNSLTLNYAQLQGNYTQLVSSYSDLQTDHSNLSTDLTNYRNLTYAFVITTIVFLALTVYFARRIKTQ